MRGTSMIDYGARDYAGMTPLHHAARALDKELVFDLVERAPNSADLRCHHLHQQHAFPLGCLELRLAFGLVVWFRVGRHGTKESVAPTASP